jgi:hypothetical protein
MRMLEANSLTFEEGCNKYLDNCRARNLREGIDFKVSSILQILR